MGKAAALEVIQHGGRALLVSRSVEKLTLAKEELLSTVPNAAASIETACVDITCEKDVEKFKEFYVHVTRIRKKSGMEKACRHVYGIDLKYLEKQWHNYINQDI